MSDFDGIESAVVSQKLPPIRPGTYVLEVLALKKVMSRTKGKLFIAEYKVTEAQGEMANPVGTSCSHIIKMSLDNALGNIKALTAAIVGEPVATVTGKMCDALVSEKNPARGKRVRAQGGEITTRAGKPFTLVVYEPFATTPTK